MDIWQHRTFKPTAEDLESPFFKFLNKHGLSLGENLRLPSLTEDQTEELMAIVYTDEQETLKLVGREHADQITGWADAGGGITVYEGLLQDLGTIKEMGRIIFHQGKLWRQVEESIK